MRPRERARYVQVHDIFLLLGAKNRATKPIRSPQHSFSGGGFVTKFGKSLKRRRFGLFARKMGEGAKLLRR